MRFLANENLPALPDVLARFVAASIASRPDWEGNFSVVEPTRVRVRVLPRHGLCG